MYSTSHTAWLEQMLHIRLSTVFFILAAGWMSWPANLSADAGRSHCCKWLCCKMRPNQVVRRPSWVAANSTIRWWHIDEPIRLLPRGWGVYNDLKLRCSMVLLTSHAQRMGRVRVPSPSAAVFHSRLKSQIVLHLKIRPCKGHTGRCLSVPAIVQRVRYNFELVSPSWCRD